MRPGVSLGLFSACKFPQMTEMLLSVHAGPKTHEGGAKTDCFKLRKYETSPKVSRTLLIFWPAATPVIADKPIVSSCAKI